MIILKLFLNVSDSEPEYSYRLHSFFVHYPFPTKLHIHIHILLFIQGSPPGKRPYLQGAMLKKEKSDLTIYSKRNAILTTNGIKK